MEASIRVRELASGIDALYASGQGCIAKTLLVDLKAARQRASEAGRELPFAPLGEGFRIAPRSLVRYPYRLEHRYGVVGVSDSEHLPAVRIQPRSEFLHAVGAGPAVHWFAENLEPLVGPLSLTVSRLDLYADFQGWALDGDQRHRFVTRATARTTREESEALAGFEFGRRKTKTVMVRIYDKTAEGRTKGLGHWPAVWGPRFVAGERVLRVEYEFGKDGLTGLGVVTLDDALARAGDLWVYGTERWLTLRVPTADQTASRWPIDPDWTVVQRASLGAAAVGAERIDAARRGSGVDGVWPSTRGYLSSLAAWTGADSIEDALNVVRRLVARDEDAGLSFAGLVRRKRLELRLV